MKLKALMDFNDNVEGVKRKKGETWEADDSRLAQLQGTKWGDLAAEVKPRRKNGAE